MAYIYVLKNKVNNKCYIGQTVQNIEKRFKKHRSKNSKCPLIYNAIKKYGWINFEKYIFQMPERELDYFETSLISKLCTIAPDGYNLDSGGHKHKHLSEILKKKISDSHKGLQAGENHPMYGRHHTEESLKKISACQIGKKLSEETKNKISNSNKGKTLTHGQRKEISERQIGKKLSEETKNKISLAHKGKKSPLKGIKLSIEHINKLSEAHKGKKQTQETKDKRSLSFKGEKNHQSKKVICVETQKVYFCITEAAFDVGLKGSGAISQCCKNKRKTAGGYHWKYYEEAV